MKRNIALSVVLSLVLLILSGCASWTSSQRVSVVPHQQEEEVVEEKLIKVNTYSQMCNALVVMIESGHQTGLMDVSEFSGSVLMYAEMAVRSALNSTPLGAYAVEKIDYEVGTRSGVETVAVNILYRFDHTHILQIDRAETMEQAFSYFEKALQNVESSAVVRIAKFEKTDFSQWVIDRQRKRPDIVIEIPAVEAICYPETGSDRVVVLNFTYHNDRQTLLEMQKDVEPVFTAAGLYVINATQAKEKYTQLYSFLTERFDYRLDKTTTPSYSLLVEGVGDSQAFADVYAAMCANADLECYVVSGTRSGEPWYWNIINFRGTYYHLDLLHSMQSGEFSPILPSEMTDYSWDTASYPN